MKRGTVVWVDLRNAAPPELGKVRPGIVVSGTVHNEVLNSVVVVPTSSLAPEIWPLRLEVGNFAGKETYAIIPGIRQVRRGRLLGAIGQLSNERLSALDDCLQAYLG
jgi:mRNA-degrading endonuclease toxin of MazEF toxin-antitoxin module